MKQVKTHRQQKKTANGNYETGREFEDYVIRLFNEDNFWLLDRQPSKHVEDFRQLDLNHPDLYLVFKRKRQYRFAVECKWRQDFNEKGYIEWAKEQHLKAYLYYQAKFNIPVFVVIGIGGKPFAPEKLFVTPLDHISRYTEVYESDLMPYKRKPTNKFFYDTVQLRLF